MFHSVIAEFSRLPEVEAIALGGSRSTGHFDALSDYDIYLYCTGPIQEETRRLILEKYTSHLEIGNCFWELEDNGTFLDGLDFDILYRNLDDFITGISHVVELYQAHNAYTTCMWHNLLTCKVLYDRDGRLGAAKKRFEIPYPEPLRQNILGRGMALLRGAMPAYELQVNKAEQRGDLVSVNHRVTGFLETYFDILLAINRLPHPGEKRLVTLCRKHCSMLPDRFEENLDSLFHHMFTDPAATSADLNRIIDELTKIY